MPPLRGTVVIAHGSPPTAGLRPRMVPIPCAHEAVRWFAARGYTVVASLRRGYGGSDGPIAELSGPCADPDYVTGATEGGRDIAAAVRFAATLGLGPPVVVGQSLGGWATLAFAASPDQGLARAAVVFAPGSGGHVAGLSARPCAEDRLVSAAARFGATARLPVLWLSADTDDVFDPALTGRMARAFDEGDRATSLAAFHVPGPGHAGFTASGGSASWGPLIGDLLDAPGS